MGRTAEETSGDRRIVREYGDDGALLRVRVEPLPPAPKPPRAPLRLPKLSLPQRKPREALPPPPAPPEGLPVTLLPYEEPAPVAEAPPPPRPAFEVVAIERVEPPAPPPEPEAGPMPAALPEPEPVVEAPPERVRYEVPDLESRVDALFAQRDRPVKARKRAPLPVPQFEPLGREPWEDRLDATLAKGS